MSEAAAADNLQTPCMMMHMQGFLASRLQHKGNVEQ